jgi:hypothetical protein
MDSLYNNVEILNGELWKVYEKYPRYIVSSHGRVYNQLTNRLQPIFIIKNGYPTVYMRVINELDKKLIQSTVNVHRLVAETFIPNPNNYPEVNHIDGNKKNNHVENLEWCTHMYNLNHAFDNKLVGTMNSCFLTNIETKETVYFRSIVKLSSHLNVSITELIGRIKYSEQYPIFGKYIIKFENENAITRMDNPKLRKVYVLDLLTNEITEYPSVISAVYNLGISRFDINKPTYRSSEYDIDKVFGYVISSNKDKLVNNEPMNRDKILQDRKRWLERPLQHKQDYPQGYYLFNYYTNTEHSFTKKEEVIAFLNTQDPVNRVISDHEFFRAVSNSGKPVIRDYKEIKGEYRIGLLKGFGLRTKFYYDGKWPPISEEKVLCSKYGESFTRVFHVKTDTDDRLIFGMFQLCQYCKCSFKMNIAAINEEDILRRSRIPNLQVTRLNNMFLGRS